MKDEDLKDKSLVLCCVAHGIIDEGKKLEVGKHDYPCQFDSLRPWSEGKSVFSSKHTSSFT